MEDSKADLFLIREALAKAEINASLHVVHDGQEAVQFLDKADGHGVPCPDLVLLDLNVPRKEGIEVLRHLRGSHCCRNSLVLVVTSSDSSRDRQETAALGSNGYFRKPSSYAEFLKLGIVVKNLLATSEAGHEC